MDRTGSPHPEISQNATSNVIRYRQTSIHGGRDRPPVGWNSINVNDEPVNRDFVLDLHYSLIEPADDWVMNANNANNNNNNNYITPVRNHTLSPIPSESPPDHVPNSGPSPGTPTPILRRPQLRRMGAYVSQAERAVAAAAAAQERNLSRDSFLPFPETEAPVVPEDLASMIRLVPVFPTVHFNPNVSFLEYSQMADISAEEERALDQTLSALRLLRFPTNPEPGPENGYVAAPTRIARSPYPAFTHRRDTEVQGSLLSRAKWTLKRSRFGHWVKRRFSGLTRRDVDKITF